jgi:hypothetical protein
VAKDRPKELTWSVLFRESFHNDEPRGWDFEKADDVDIDDGVLEYELDDDTDVIVYNGRGIPLDRVEITFRGRAEDSGFRVLLIGREGLVGVAMGVEDNSVSLAFLGKGGATVGRSGGKVFEEDRWHGYRIRRVGPMIEAWCDGRRVIRARGDASVGGTGQLIFGGEEGSYQIDDVVVRTAR